MNELDNVMERIGRILAYDRNLKVEVRGSQAYAVPGRIVIPRIENYSVLGHGAERMLHGLLDHEVGHARHTTFALMERAHEEGGKALRHLLNAIEDARIERLMGAEFPGAATNLRLKNRWFWTMEKSAAAFAKMAPFAAYTFALTLYMRGAVSLDDIRTRRPDVAAMISASRAFGIDAPLATTEDALALARRIFDALKQPPTPPPPSGEDDESDEGEGDEGDDEGSEGDDEGSDGDESDDGDSEERDDDGVPDGDDGVSDEGSDGDEGSEDSDDADGEGEGDDDGDEGSDDDGDGGSEGDDADEDSDGGESADGNGDDADDADGDDADGDDESAKGADGGDAGSGGDDADEDESADGAHGAGPSPLDDIRNTDFENEEISTHDPESAMRALLATEYDGKSYKTFDPEAFDFVRDLDREPIERHGANEGIDTILRDAAPASYALASAFEAGFRARRERRPVMGADEGDVNIPALIEFAHASASADTIYEQFVAEEQYDTVVSIVLDCSGSMQAARDDDSSRRRRNAPPRRPRAYLARRAACAMSLALSQCGIAHEITGFTAIDSNTSVHPWFADRPEQTRERFAQMRAALIEAIDHGLDPETLSRECGYLAGYYKRLEIERGCPLQSAAYAVFKNFDSARLDALGWAIGIHQNLDGEAILWNAKRLAARPEKRRVMIVLSDGHPAGGKSSRTDAEHLKNMIRAVEAAGIEVYGVGIETTAPQQFYTRSWIANSVDHLVEVAMTSLVEVLSEGRQECESVRVA